MKLLLIILSITISGCASKIQRVTSSPSPIINDTNTETPVLNEPLTGDVIQNTPEIVTVHANEVFVYFLAVVICLCVLCGLPNLVNYFQAKKRLKDQSPADDSRIVLND